MHMIVIAAAAALAFAAGPAAAQDTKSAEASASAHVEATRAAIKAGDLATASAEDDQALAAYDSLYAGERRRIYCGMNMPEALAYMALASNDRKAAVAIDPGWCNALYFKGYILVEVERVAEARRYYERALAMAPMHWQFLSELGYTYRDSDPARSLDLYGQAEGGIALIDKAAQAKATAIVRHGKGYALTELKRYDEAASYYRLCLKDDPNDQLAIHELDYIEKHRPR